METVLKVLVSQTSIDCKIETVIWIWIISSSYSTKPSSMNRRKLCIWRRWNYSYILNLLALVGTRGLFGVVYFWAYANNLCNFYLLL
jgi:hypothetical protein